MIRLSIGLPETDSWIFEAIELAQNASRSRGPVSSKAEIVRSILIPALEVYRPKQEEVSSNGK